MDLNVEKARELYGQMLSNDVDFREFSVPDLFQLASLLAVVGDYAARTVVLNQFVLAHPESSEAHWLRVRVHNADIVRRLQNPSRAIAMLDEISGLPAESPEVLLEYWQALGECYLALDRLNEAVEAARMVLAIAEAADTTPSMMSYYVETLANRKLIAGEIDEELQEAVSKFEELARDPRLDPAKSLRVKRGMLMTRGRYKAALGQASQALDDLAAAHELAPDVQPKLIIAAEYLWVAFQAHLEHTDRANAMAEFFREHASAPLLTTLTGVTQKITFVKNRLGMSS